MFQEPREQIGSQQQQLLLRRLAALSFKEKSRILFRATQHLPYKNKAEILGAGGMQFLQKSFFPLALHLLYKHFVKGAIWSVIATVMAIFCLVILVYLAQANPTEMTPVLATVVAYFVGFFLAALFRVGKEIYQLTRRTVSKEEYKQILRVVQDLDSANKTVVLRALSIDVSRFGAEERLLIAPFLTEIALLVGVGLLAGLIVLLSALHISAGLSASFLLLVTVATGFLGGFFIRRVLFYVLSFTSRRQQRKKQL